MLDQKKSIWSWALYDWANSAFATTVMAGFFPVFFKLYWSTGADATVSTAQLGLANSLSGVFMGILAPILGAVADRAGSKKKFLIFFVYCGVLMTVALFWVEKGHWQAAAALYVLSVIGFSGANIFYDALLPGVAGGKIDYVSSLGYALGYLGGGLLFAVCVWMNINPQLFRLGAADAGSAQAIRVSFILVGLWWGVFTIPLMLFVSESGPSQAKKSTACIADGFRQLYHSFSKIRSMKNIFLFLLAYWFYIDGIDTIVRMAVDYGLSIGFAYSDLIIALLITQFVGFPSAIIYGSIGEKVGPKKAIYFGLLVYLLVVIWAIMMNDKTEFYILAVVIGLVQGGVQALSRSYFARLIPTEQAGEFYGFYNMLGKFAVILGPAVIGMTGRISGSPRAGIASIALFFILGAVLLFFVKEPEGINSAI
jgi:UMF1 family MFS transporter